MRGGLLAGGVAAILLVLAATLAGAAFLLPRMDEAERAAVRMQAEDAVDTIVARQQAVLDEAGAYRAFGPQDVAADPRLMELPWGDWPTQHYLFEARATPEGGLRVRAVPRADSVRALEAGAQFYGAELSPDGAVSGSGWFPERQ